MTPWHRRKGLTLLEVVLALAIFLAAIAVLSQLISTGVRAAVQSRWQTHAILRCESKMAEVVAGIEPMQEVTEAGFDDDDEDVWRWSLQVTPSSQEGLLELTVTAWRIAEDKNALTGTSYSLTRFMHDSEMLLESAEARSTEVPQ